ncbi:MAG: class II aldolase/adducin family protein [Halobacteriovoraceae bacterium]|jgi:L-ribulose-5-phosphate 4-epimerase|nr:class II aldolase/adducin family protein [Halobacteriovoraceae bacterium]
MSNSAKEGIIKFKIQLKKASQIEQKLYLGIEKWRTILYKMNFIGECPTDKVGFGNISQRISPQSLNFVISGTQTGKFPLLDGSQYTKITECNLEKMFVSATGPIAPSSESLTHFAIYNSSPQINTIFHIHHQEFWQFLLENNFPKTSADIEYGTLAMAMATKNCIGNKSAGIFAMEGHQNGIIAYGETPEQAGRIILDIYKDSKT